MLKKVFKPIARSMQVGPSRSHWQPIDDKLLGLTEDQQMLRETAHKFFVNELDPYANKIDFENNFDDFRGFWRKLGDMGFINFFSKKQKNS